ncbi:MAG: ABC transporter ATPase [Weeksellaceae bacterium]
MQLPKNSKVWIYQGNRNFTGEEINDIESVLNEFMKEWNAHGEPITADYAIPYDRFIVVAADQAVPTSGCSEDDLSRTIRAIDTKYGLDLLNRMKVSFHLDGEISTIPLNDFKAKVRNNEIPEHANIFHNGVTTLQEFEENWEMPLEESWVKTLLKQNS